MSYCIDNMRVWGDTFFIKDALQKIKNSHIQISSEGMIHFAIAFVAELFFKNDLLQGIGLMLLLIFAIGAVLFLIQMHKVKHWRAQNPVDRSDTCRAIPERVYHIQDDIFITRESLHRIFT